MSGGLPVGNGLNGLEGDISIIFKTDRRGLTFSLKGVTGYVVYSPKTIVEGSIFGASVWNLNSVATH